MSPRFLTCHYTVYMSLGAEASILLESPWLCSPPDLAAPSPVVCGSQSLLRPWRSSTPSLLAFPAGPLFRGGNMFQAPNCFRGDLQSEQRPLSPTTTRNTCLSFNCSRTFQRSSYCSLILGPAVTGDYIDFTSARVFTAHVRPTSCTPRPSCAHTRIHTPFIPIFLPLYILFYLPERPTLHPT